jgi:hypothetical protein
MECSICLNVIVSTDKSFKTDCNHCFHEQCIKGWINHNKKSCPNCRRDINQKIIQKFKKIYYSDSEDEFEHNYVVPTFAESITAFINRT